MELSLLDWQGSLPEGLKRLTHNSNVLLSTTQHACPNNCGALSARLARIIARGPEKTHAQQQRAVEYHSACMPTSREASSTGPSFEGRESVLFFTQDTRQHTLCGCKYSKKMGAPAGFHRRRAHKRQNQNLETCFSMHVVMLKHAVRAPQKRSSTSLHMVHDMSELSCGGG